MTAKSTWLGTKVRKAAALEREPEHPPIEDARTPEDIKNGWSYEAWAKYHAEVSRPEIAALFGPRKPKLPTRANSKYSPHRGLSHSPFRWRRGR
jgi:hypothetical protein